jgi:hypothetical protein
LSLGHHLFLDMLLRELFLLLHLLLLLRHLLLLLHLLDDAHGAGLTRLLLRGVDEVTDLDAGDDGRRPLPRLLGPLWSGDDDAGALLALYKER